jgi:hypothetical protein
MSDGRSPPAESNERGVEDLQNLPKGRVCRAVPSARHPPHVRSHHVFQPAGGTIPAGSRCPTCDWEYQESQTRKVRVWELDSRVRNMLRNKIIIEVTLRLLVHMSFRLYSLSFNLSSLSFHLCLLMHPLNCGRVT